MVYLISMKNCLIKVYWIFFGALICVPFLSFADGTGGGATLKNPIKAGNLAQLLASILDIIVQIGIPVVTIAFIYVGYLFVSAMGNQTKLKEAKGAFVNVCIGAAIVLGSYAISAIISNTIASLAK